MLKPIPNNSRKGMANINTNNVAQRSDLLIRPTAILNQYINGIQQYAYGGQPTMRALDFGNAGIKAAQGAAAGAASGAAGGAAFAGIGAPIGAGIGAAVGAVTGFISGVFEDDANRKKEYEQAKAQFQEDIKKEETRTDEIKEEMNVTSKASEGKGYYAAMGLSDVPNEELIKPDINGPYIRKNDIRNTTPVADNTRLDRVFNIATKVSQTPIKTYPLRDNERNSTMVADKTRMNKITPVIASITSNNNTNVVSNDNTSNEYMNRINSFDATATTRTNIEECTKFNRMYLESIGNDPAAVGFTGDAWNIGNNILDNGGSIVYDSGYKISNQKASRDEINNSVVSAIKSNKLDVSSLKEGDVVDIHYPNSKYVQQAFEESNFTTATTHNGVIVNKDGKLYVQHNISGNVKLDPVNNPSYNIARVYRPNWGRPDFNKPLKGKTPVTDKYSPIKTLQSAFGITSNDKQTGNNTYDLTDAKVANTRTGEYTPNTNSILFGDFVESANVPRQTLLASDYMNLKKHRPNRKITSAEGDDVISKVKDTDIFYGIEDGELKIDSLHNFKPNTIVTPSKFKSNINDSKIVFKDGKPSLRVTVEGKVRYNNIQTSNGKVLVSAKRNKDNNPTDSIKLIAGTPTYIQQQLASFMKHNKDVKLITVDNGRFKHRYEKKNKATLDEQDYANHYSSDFNRDYFPSNSISLIN